MRITKSNKKTISTEGAVEKINNGDFSKEVLEYLKNIIDNIPIDKYNKLAKYYENDIVTLNKKEKLTNAPNNKIMNNYARYITEINVGYFMGSPLSYKSENDITELIELNKQMEVEELDKKNAKKLSKYGRCYELIFINEDSEIRSKTIDARNATIVKSNTLEEKDVIGLYFTNEKKEYTIYIYTVDKAFQIKTDFKKVEVLYENQNIFAALPLIEYKNNEEAVGDFQNVRSLIDAYNKVVSNDIDNIEDFIDSILLIKGQRITEEDMKLLQETRGLILGEGSEANYITKSLDEQGITAVLYRLSQNIHKFSFTPDMSDQNFAGNSSGVALEYKLLPFELHTLSKESNYRKGIGKRLELINTFLSIKKNTIIDLDKVEIIFKRGLPRNDAEMSGMIATLQGIVSNKTLISGLSFVKDAEKEIAEVEKQKQEDNDRMINQLTETSHFKHLEDEEEIEEDSEEK